LIYLQVDYMDVQGMTDMGMMYPPGMPQQEMSPEQKAEMEMKMKEAEEKRRKAQITSLRQNLKLKNASLNVMEKSIAKVKADKDVLVNVELEAAETEWHRKAVQAEIEEIGAVIEEMTLRCEIEKEERSSLEERLRELEEKKEDKEKETTEEEPKESSQDTDRNYL
jgi:hypothetical protein